TIKGRWPSLPTLASTAERNILTCATTTYASSRKPATSTSSTSIRTIKLRTSSPSPCPSPSWPNIDFRWAFRPN
ncbi:hypothetical protein OC846_006362, partial [Tilletia horrida]